MKKLIFSIVAVMMLMTLFAAYSIQAADYYKQPQTTLNSKPFVYQWTLISATSSTGAGDTFKFGMPMTNVTCQSIFSGVTATNATVLIQGSLDGGTTWGTVVSSATVSTTSGALFESTSYAVDQIRANISSINTYSATGSKVTVRCEALQ